MLEHTVVQETMAEHANLLAHSSVAAYHTVHVQRLYSFMHKKCG